MGHKTPISFNLRKHAEQHCTAKQKNKVSYNTDYNDWKEIKTQTEKRNIHNSKKSVTKLTKNW